MESLGVFLLMIVGFFCALSFCFGGSRRFIFRTKKLIGIVIIIAICYMLFIK